MTILTLPRKELESQIGKIDEKMESRISMFGTPVEEVTDSEVSVEVFPNRPDLLSLQGFVRAINAFLGKKTGLKKYNVKAPEKDYKVVIDKSVKKVRPFTTCAIVKGLKFDDEKIKEIIEIQEKLHSGFGRNRKKVAIGIYPLEVIKLPIKFLAKVPEDIKFQPLEFPREINGRQILSQHPKGRDYADLLKDCEVFPIFEDANKEILSMPPIINSEKTGKIDSNTKGVFIECSGHNLEFLKKALNMIVCPMAEMGGQIYQMELIDGNKKELSPNLDAEKLEFSRDYLNKNLGLELNDKQIKDYLGKMGIGVEKNNALIPSYRADILHEIDLAEEVAIAYGYENFIPEIPEFSTIGKEDKTEILKRKIAETLIGLGLLEISTFHLSTKERQFRKIGIKEYIKDVIEVEDSKTENNILRASLLANSIKILSENSDAAYPQKIFELGKVFYHDDKSEAGIGEEERLCVSLCHETANFTEIKQVLDYLSRMFEFEYEIKDVENASFIEGRVGSIFIKDKEGRILGNSIGVLGEVNPNVIKNNKIKMPVACLEIKLEGFI